jgi:hypothetical protein
MFFFCWYWTVGFPSARAGYTFITLCLAFPLYYTTISQGQLFVLNGIFTALIFLDNSGCCNEPECRNRGLVIQLPLPIRHHVQRCIATLQPARLVAVDVPPVPLHIFDQRSPWKWYVISFVTSLYLILTSSTQLLVAGS